MMDAVAAGQQKSFVDKAASLALLSRGTCPGAADMMYHIVDHLDLCCAVS